ncbi:TonB-dependent receptor [Pseudomonas matsuisoli]|uniref:TonB-dependent receptor n=1 Tax=Pseudomonas matsuisoli TaxID=1515666 RepID=A0A917PQ92_9PSED|nr:TonB-dependent receptor [Pseudomonas matsuisoli]GGJ86917.1 TonB-dependent receptor [Pseudomonas matsuisoli]
MIRCPLRRTTLSLMICLPGVALGEDAGVLALPDVTVSATKQDTTTFNTPSAVTVIGGEQLDTYRYDNLAEIAQRTPNAGFTGYTPNSPQLTIRGLGFSDDESDSTSTSVFIDGIPVHGKTLGQPFDMEQVEILRGPQNLLYGKNSMGGVVAFKTRDPGFTAGGNANFEYGTDNRMRAEVAGDLPLSDNTAIRAVVGGEKSDGFVENDTLNDEGADWKSRFGRLKLLHLDDAGGEWRFGLSHLENHGGNDYFTTRDLASKHQSDNTEPGRNNLEYSLLTGEYKRELANNRKLVVLAGASQSEWNYWMPESAYDAISGFDAKTKEFNLESRLTGVDGDFDWLVGGYASHIKRESPYLYEMPGMFVSATTADVDGDTFAAFGELGWRFAPDWRAAAGLRIEHYRADMDWSADVTGAGFNEVNDVKARDTVALPRFTLEYQPDDQHFAWLTLARGYKASGFNIYATDASSAGQSYDPEYGNYVELGYRLRDANRRWELEGVVFYTRLRDQQVVVIGDENQSLTDNAGKSHNQGVELSAKVRPIDSLELRAFAAWVEAEYDEYTDTDGNDLEGTQFPDAPRNSQGVSATWTPDEHWTLGVGASRQAKSYLYPQTEYTNDAYTLVDANVSYRLKNWTVGLYGKNLGNAEYFGRVANNAFVPGTPRSVGVSVGVDF